MIRYESQPIRLISLFFFQFLIALFACTGVRPSFRISAEQNFGFVLASFARISQFILELSTIFWIMWDWLD